MESKSEYQKDLLCCSEILVNFNQMRDKSDSCLNYNFGPNSSFKLSSKQDIWRSRDCSWITNILLTFLQFLASKTFADDLLCWF